MFERESKMFLKKKKKTTKDKDMSLEHFSLSHNKTLSAQQNNNIKSKSHLKYSAAAA